jgi:hypothetical protein
MPATSQATPNGNATSEEAARSVAIDEAMVAALTAQVAELNERVARGLSRLDALQSTDSHRPD